MKAPRHDRRAGSPLATSRAVTVHGGAGEDLPSRPRREWQAGLPPGSEVVGRLPRFRGDADRPSRRGSGPHGRADRGGPMAGGRGGRRRESGPRTRRSCAGRASGGASGPIDGVIPSGTAAREGSSSTMRTPTPASSTTSPTTRRRPGTSPNGRRRSGPDSPRRGPVPEGEDRRAGAAVVASLQRTDRRATDRRFAMYMTPTKANPEPARARDAGSGATNAGVTSSFRTVPAEADSPATLI